jgi:MFS family permease
MAASPGQHWAQAVVSEEPIALQPGKLREVNWGEVGVRFAFGAAVSLVAGVAGVLVGAGAGGLWLAFPAILPAGLTLVERKENRRQAERDVRGAILGAVGMVAFAVAVYIGVPLVGGLVAVLVALVVWLVVTLGLYLGLRALLVKRDPHPN